MLGQFLSLKRGVLFIGAVWVAACTPTSPQNTPPKGHLGSKPACQQYSGLPERWLEDELAGMVKIPGGSFQIGKADGYAEERALTNSRRTVADFWMDQTEVSNAQFSSFVRATGYVTEAERQGEAAVFVQPTEPVAELGWWKLLKGANWRQPWGPDSNRQIADNEPVRMITLQDAAAYAAWLGRSLPTEEQWEYAAKGFSNQRDIGAGSKGTDANIWHGEFPYRNTQRDGYADVAPVGCYPANGFGLFDTLGNVWEYTQTPFSGSHDDHMGMAQLSKNHGKHSFNRYTIKGGSFLCADNYCMRYRAAARHPQEKDLAISHVGFRTVLNRR